MARLWTSGDDGHNPDYARLLALARARDVALPVPAALTIGTLAITPLGPWWEDHIAAPTGLSVNDASLVLRLAFAGRAALFPGDLEADGEGELVGRQTLGERVAADLLKVPHHGSRTSSSPVLVGPRRWCTPGPSSKGLSNGTRLFTGTALQAWIRVSDT